MQLKHTTDPDLLWRDYYYRSGVNQTMRDGLADVVSSAQKYAHEGLWVDIGANDGTLLSRVPDTYFKIGVDPARNLAASLEEHADVVLNDYFQDDDRYHGPDGEGLADVITSCACFYDVQDPGSFVATVAGALNEHGVWINQMTMAEDMMRLNAFDNIVHEHVIYWDLATLQHLYHQHGLKIVEISHNQINGASTRVVAKRGSARKEAVRGAVVEEARAFAQRARKWKQLMEWIMDSLGLAGRSVWGYAASTKGALLLQWLDHNHQIVGIADRNPTKYGTMMPGVWIPITDEATMRQAKPDVLLALAWGFKQEFVEREKELLAGGTSFLLPLPHPEFIL